MSKTFKDYEYTRVQLESPAKDFPGNDNSAFDDNEDVPDVSDDRQNLTNENNETEPKRTKWPFEYCQQFFDVDTQQVIKRLIGSMVPHPSKNFIRQTLRPKPDLYGPFWVTTTLVFTIAIAGNIANYFQFQGKHYQWRYDFKKVTFAATAIYSYCWLVPLIVWTVTKWKIKELNYSFIEILAVYGYSLTIYIPISMLWVIPIEWLQWLLVICAMLLSGSVLALTFLPALREGNRHVGLAVVVTILLFHAALAMGFMLYFFHVPSSEPIVLPTSSSTTSVTKAALLKSTTTVKA